MSTASYAMLTAAQHVAPNAAAQEGFAEIRRVMQGCNEPDNKITLEIASAVVDGLRYGNWPNQGGLIEPEPRVCACGKPFGHDGRKATCTF